MTYVNYTDEQPPEGEVVRRARCSDCAFTPGTEASADPLTAVKAQACVESMSYFYCHRDVTDSHYIEEPEALCAGWLQKVTELLDKSNSPQDRAEAFLRLSEVSETEDLMRKALTRRGEAVCQSKSATTSTCSSSGCSR
jgi:hypothetical protein